jgi:hypothetical protein
MIILYFIVVFLILAFLIFYSFSYLSALQRLVRGDAPFVPVPTAALSEIAKALEINENSIVYDLGCGDGKVLVACSRIQPKANYFGYEISFAIFLLAWIRSFRQRKSSKIKILRKNFFHEDFSGATHVFTYLMPKQMKKLEKKFEDELSSGARLVSCTFALQNKKPDKVIDLNLPKYSIASKLYVYNY